MQITAMDLNFSIAFDRIDIYQFGLFPSLIRAARQVGSEVFSLRAGDEREDLGVPQDEHVPP
jgi:hypothetical protein